MQRPSARNGGGVPRSSERADALIPGARILVILGPTGVGKSAIAVAVAERIGGEIVGCDALQVYRGFDAATAKPDASERARVPHHVIDHVDPDRDYTVADYVREADDAIGEIVSRGNVPVVVGGTGMYLRGLLRGVVDAPARDGEVRRRLRRWVGRRGSRRLHRVLARVDPVTAARVAPNDAQRIVRALEVAFVTGTPLGRRIASRGTWAEPTERYRARKFGIHVERARHLDRLRTRTERFFEAGLVDEVRRLLDSGVRAEANAFKAIGYREALEAIVNGRVEPDELLEAVFVHTRQLAKRQRTWFRGEPDVVWLDATDGPSVAIDRIIEEWS